MNYFLKEQVESLKKHGRPIITYTVSPINDSSFCSLELIKYAISLENSKTIFILTSENYAHYHYIGLKQGVKIEDAVRQGKLKIIDLFSKGISYFDEEIPVTESLPKTWLDTPGDQKTYAESKNLIQFLEQQIKDFMQNSEQSFIIVEDLLSLLINLKDRTDNQQEFRKQALTLFEQVRKMQSEKTQLHIVGQHFEDENTQDEIFEQYNRLFIYLQKYADVIVSVVSNSSGYSKDFDGHIFIQRNYENQINVNKVLYKQEAGQVKTLSALQVL